MANNVLGHKANSLSHNNITNLHDIPVVIIAGLASITIILAIIISRRAQDYIPVRVLNTQ